MNLLVTFVLLLVTGQCQNVDGRYTIADLVGEKKGVKKFEPKDPEDPAQKAAEAIFAKCYKFVHTFIDSTHGPNPRDVEKPAIHFSLLKSTDVASCRDKSGGDGGGINQQINIRRFQFAILAGRTKSERDRMPIGILDPSPTITDAEFKGWSDYCTNPSLQDPLDHSQIKYHRRLSNGDAIRIPSVNSVYFKDKNDREVGVDKILVFNFTKNQGEDDLKARKDNLDLGAFKWYPIVSFTFHYPGNQNYVELMGKLLPHGAGGKRLFLDFIGEANFFTDGGGSKSDFWTNKGLTKTNVVEFNPLDYDQSKTDCKKVGGRELRFVNPNKAANEEYEGNDKPTIFSNMCNCFFFFTPEDFYQPHLENPQIYITEQKYHPDPELRNCFQLEINDEIEPRNSFEYLWITLRVTTKTCGNYFDSYKGIAHSIRPLQTPETGDVGFVKIIALDSKGLPFGKWSTEHNGKPAFPCEQSKLSDKTCRDKKNVLFMISKDNPSNCAKPFGYDAYDDSTDRSKETHNEANLNYFVKNLVSEDPIIGYGWNVKFTPTYINSNLLKTVQFIAEIAITKIVKAETYSESLFYPEIISVRSPVYTLEISNSKIAKKPATAPPRKAIDIYINRDLYKEACRNLTTILPPVKKPLAYEFYLCRYFHEEIPLSKRYVAFDSEATIADKYKNCFILNAYPGRKENSLHIEFLQWNNLNSYPEIPSYCRGLYGVEIAVEAVNEFGYPVGTFEVYTGLGDQLEDKCIGGRNTAPRYASLITKNYPCFFIRGKSEKYNDQVTKADETPHIFGYKVIEPTDKENVGGISLLWRYQPRSTFKGPFPTTIEIYAEVYIPSDIDPQGPSVVVLRSKKYKFKYASSGGKLDQSRNCKDDAKNDWFEKDADDQTVEIEDFILECKSLPASCGLSLTEPLPPPPPPIPHIIGLEPTSAPVLGGGPQEVERAFGNLDWYSGCDVSKGCITPPIEDDQEEKTECFSEEKQNCKMLVTFGDNPLDDEEVDVNSEIIMEMYNPTAYKWMALGFSDDRKMPSSFVIQCVSESVVTLYPSFNIPGRFDNKRLADDEMDSVPIRLLKSDKQGSKLYCRFAVKKRFTVLKIGETKLDHTFDLLNKPYFLLYAWGVSAEDGQNGNLKPHKPQKERKASSKKIALAARFSPDASQRVLLRYHATLMLTGILFFLTLGLFTGRFFKESYVTVKFLGKPLWLIAHIIFTTIALVLMLTGLSVEIIGHQGWTGLTPANFHSYSGVVIFGLIVVVYGVGWFLKPTKYGHRNWAAAAHALIGNFVYWLSIMVMVNSDKVSFSGMPCTIKFIVGTYAATVLILFGALSYHYCWVDWIMGITGRGVNIFLPIGVAVPALARNYIDRRIRRRRSHGIDILLDPTDDENPVEAPGKWMRMSILGLTAFLGLCYTFWAVFLLWRNSSGRRDCYTTREIFEFSKNS